MSGSVLFWVQYLLGIGHLQRSLRVADALRRAGLPVTLVNGGPPAPALTAASCARVVQLPPVRAVDARFELIDADGRPLGDEVRAARRSAVLAVFAEARPDAVIVEGFPFARRAFAFELDPLIAAAREAGAAVLCSIRDVVVMRPDPERHHRIAARVRDDFAAVLVHGDPAFLPFSASFPAAAAIAERMIYTGYVTEPARAIPAAGLPRGEVLVSAGGGVAGGALMAAAMEARRRGCLADSPWRLLAGSHLPDAEFGRLRAAAPAGVSVERFRSDFPALLRHCRVSVSQLGYNTALDLLAARVPAVVVPFAAGNETEQELRAERLAALGAVELVREDALSPDALTAALERAVTRPPRAVDIDTDGAARSARIVARIIDGGDPRDEGLRRRGLATGVQAV